jgi:L-iditol 2-dehydrogenase
MKAAVLHGREDVRIESIEPRPLESGEVRICIEAALTCGTDLKVYKRGYHARMIVPPAVFGHELAGTIEEVHAPSETWRIGDRVVVANSAPCEQCAACIRGQHNLCDDLQFLNGAYAESIVVPARLVERNLLRVKADVKFEDAALVEPLACVVQGIEESRVAGVGRVLVLGAGPIGLMFARLARHLGAGVTVAGRGQARLKRAVQLGAEQVVMVKGERDLVQEVVDETGGGFDTVIEAVGKPETWEAAVRLARKGGVVNFFGGCPSGTSVQLDTGLVHYSNLTLLASFHHTPRTIRRALRFIEERVIQAEDFVDGECGLSSLPDLFRSMAAGNRAVKTLIRVRE